jgi:hypothetical protein
MSLKFALKFPRIAYSHFVLSFINKMPFSTSVVFQGEAIYHLNVKKRGDFYYEDRLYRIGDHGKPDGG